MEGHVEVGPIRGSKSDLLAGRRVVLAVTGGVAAYKAVDLARELIRHGADVRVVMTRSATRLISPVMFEWATGNTPITRIGGWSEHVSVCGSADMVVVAPATANTMSKAASGIADTPVTLCVLAALGSGVPLLFVPTMNLAMWESQSVRNVVGRLVEMGIRVLEPHVEEGKAKFPPVNHLVDYILGAHLPRDMAGMRVLVTAGPTREWLDATKFISTPSSGITGLQFALEAHARGADVDLILGPAPLDVPTWINTHRVSTTREMYEKALYLAKQFKYDVAVLSAAPLDFYPASSERGKLSSDVDHIHVKLVPTPKLARDLRGAAPCTVIVGFKAEVNVDDDRLVGSALRRLREGGWDMALAHDVAKSGFGTDMDKYVLVYNDGAHEVLGPAHKRLLAREVLSRALRLRGEKCP